MSGPLTLALGLLFATAVSAATAAESAADGAASDVVLVVDASGSMRAKVGGQPKMDVARRVLRDVVGKVPAGAQIGLVAYGHRSESDCKDIETIVPVGSGDRAALLTRVDALPAKGKTPITGALTQVFDDLATRERPATVVLVSDGIETCGGDPCKTVRDARAAGRKFILHVVGFDLGPEDVSQLECAAQAGGGLYFGARDAKELGTALEQAVALTPETPAGRIAVKATANGALADTLIEVRKHGSNEVVTTLRTYTAPDTNPRVITLPAGMYDLRATAVAIKGRPHQLVPGVLVVNGKTADRDVDFGTGVLRVTITRNGALGGSIVQVVRAGTKDHVTSLRTYQKPETNPAVFPLPSGNYDLVINSVDLADTPTARVEGVAVGSTLVERSHDFASGTLRVDTTHGSRPIAAVIEIADATTNAVKTSLRTDASPDNMNAITFLLTPGSYRVSVTPLKKEDGGKRQLDVVLAKGGSVEKIFDFAAAP